MIQTRYSVPYVALGQGASDIKQELLDAFEGVLDSGQYVLGPHVTAFESEFAKRCQSRFAAGVSNGTCSLHLVLRGIGLGEGDEVITVPNSFVASAATIALVGARPVFVDIRADLNIDPGLIEAAITTRTKAIVPVHLTGRPAQMAQIMDIAERRGLFVLEDAAQAIDAKLDGRTVGGWGHASCLQPAPTEEPSRLRRRWRDDHQ